jgi:polyisoprenoid-binding protein YceI
MKRLALVTGILALVAPLALAQTSTWTSDPNHSEVDFSITHLSVSNVHGRFDHQLQRGGRLEVHRERNH